MNKWGRAGVAICLLVAVVAVLWVGFIKEANCQSCKEHIFTGYRLTVNIGTKAERTYPYCVDCYEKTMSQLADLPLTSIKGEYFSNTGLFIASGVCAFITLLYLLYVFLGDSVSFIGAYGNAVKNIKNRLFYQSNRKKTRRKAATRRSQTNRRHAHHEEDDFSEWLDD